MKKSVLSPCALSDADDARRWYESCEPGLGSEFVRALEECLSRIEADPELYRIVLAPYRKALMRRFPFRSFMKFVRTAFGFLRFTTPNVIPCSCAKG